MLHFSTLTFHKTSFLLVSTFKFRFIIFIYISLCTSNGYTQTSLIDSIITEKKLKEIVYQIADDSLQGRYTNSIGCLKAAEIIAERMEDAGLKSLAEMNGYFQDTDSSFRNVRNVLGAISGKSKKEEVVIISAHYDHIGLATTAFYRFLNKLKNGGTDTIFNGANDDASGVAVMLMLAEYFAQRPVERTILFVAFSGEEVGFIGSYGLCAVMNPRMIVTQINLEMLGRRGSNRRPFITGDWYSNLQSILNRNLHEATGNIDYFKKDVNDIHQYFQRSDNYPFAINGIPAHSIMLTTDDDRLYHTVDDAPKTLDYKLMCSVAKNIALAIEPLVQGKITPQRIDTRKIQEDKNRFLNKFR